MRIIKDIAFAIGCLAALVTFIATSLFTVAGIVAIIAFIFGWVFKWWIVVAVWLVAIIGLIALASYGNR